MKASLAWYDEYVTVAADSRYADLLRIAYRQAWKHSDDDSTKTGALLVDHEYRVLVSENNHFPPCAREIKGALERPAKYDFNNHAERAAVYLAARKGIKTNGLIMIMPWLPCVPCANAIIFSGIHTLICHRQMVDRTLADWQPKLRDALELLHKNHVKVIMYDGSVGNCKAVFRGVEWEP